MIEFASPIWDTRNSVYKVSITSSLTAASAPQYIDISGWTSLSELEIPDTETKEFKDLLKTIVTALLEKDRQASWFSTRLKETTVLRKLVHTWKATADTPPPHEWSVLHWKPVSLKIGKDGFTLLWEVSSYSQSTPRISSRFLPAVSGPPSPRPESPTAPVIPTTTRQITIQAEEAVYDDIPFSNEHTAEVFEEQVRDKQSLQEARLRLALAKLKAQRLSENYYKKYGELYEEEETDSEEESVNF
jgi:hypothetical protein